jgi:hypothetical protein
MTNNEFDLSDFDYSPYHAGLRPDSILLVSDWADANRFHRQRHRNRENFGRKGLHI